MHHWRLERNFREMFYVFGVKFLRNMGKRNRKRIPRGSCRREVSEMIAFILVFLLGVAVGAGSIMLIAFVRAKALIKDLTAIMNKPQEEAGGGESP